MWARQHCYSVLGSLLLVRSQDNAVADEIRRLWSPFGVSPGVARSLDTFSIRERSGRLDLYHDDVTVIETASRDRLMTVASAEINRHVLGRFRGLSVHAGVVAGRGGAICFPGGSGVGKSTLVAGAVVAGLRYVSDEALCLDYSTLQVVPYPKPVALDAWPRQKMGLEGQPGETLIAAERFNPVNHDEDLMLSDVVVPIRRPGPPTLEPMARSLSVAALLENSFNHYRRPAAAVKAATALATNTRSWRLEYEDAFEAAVLLAEQLA